MADQAFTDDEWNSVTQERETGEAPPAQEALPEQVPETTDPATSAPEKPSEAALPPDVLEKLKRFDDLAAAMPSLINELKEAKGRIGALQSEFAKSRQQAAAEQPSQTQIAAAAKDPEKWSQLKEDFPDWGEAISAFVDSRLAGVKPGTQGPTAEQIEQLIAQRAEATTAELRRQFNEQLVDVVHPTWRDEVKTADFAAWHAVQPPEIKALAGSDDGRDAVRMLNLYAQHKAKPVETVQQDRKQRLQAAATTGKQQGTGAVVAKRFEDMTPDEQWDHLAKERERPGR